MKIWGGFSNLTVFPTSCSLLEDRRLVLKGKCVCQYLMISELKFFSKNNYQLTTDCSFFLLPVSVAKLSGC